jgi:hypothetical protein
MKFHENPLSGSRILYGETDRRLDLTKLIDAFSSFASVPEKEYLCCD